MGDLREVAPEVAGLYLNRAGKSAQAKKREEGPELLAAEGRMRARGRDEAIRMAKEQGAA